MGIYDQLVGLNSDYQDFRKSGGYTPKLHGILQNIGDAVSPFLSPRGRQTAMNVAEIADMFNPAGDTLDAMEMSRQGDHLGAMVNVAGMMIPVAVVKLYGPQTALAAAKAIQETLTGTGDSLGQVGAGVYDKFIERMSQRQPMPTMYSNPLPGVLPGLPKALKINKGHYEYRGYSIEKLDDAPELDWRIHDADGNWHDSLSTLAGAKKSIDALVPSPDASSPQVVPGDRSGTTARRAPTNTGSKTILMPDGTRIPRPKTMAEVPDIRNMSVEDALFIARQEPHIIAGGESSRGGFIGGPENLKNRKNLNAQRAHMDQEIANGADAGDWYDRFRASIDNVTSNPDDATWMAKKEGMYSAGVSPEGELAYALKDTNSAIATGADPNLMVKPARPAQKSASIRAIQGNDPLLHQLGEKTGEYANKIDPLTGQSVKTATGVNDFRHARLLGFTEPGGAPQRGALGGPSHTFSDYETALSVHRSNEVNLAGRSDWTGEQVQASPWVQQKADDFYKRGKTTYDKRAIAQLERSGSNMGPGEVDRVGREIAFEDANRTIGDFFPKHTAFDTYEAQPYVGIMDHLSGLSKANQAERTAFANLPESTWAGSDGRDSLYAGLRSGDTGNAMRVLPTTKMQGVYTPPSGVTEYNPGEVARPLVGFDNSGKTKKLAEHDRMLMDAAGNVRAVVDAQGAAAWHKPWAKGDDAYSNDVFAGFPGSERPATGAELGVIGDLGKKYNLGDVIDTGQGVTMTNFDDALSLSDEIGYGAADPAYLKKNQQIINKEGTLRLSKKEFGALSKDLDAIGFSKAKRVDVDSGYIGYEDAWGAGKGSGEVTKQLLDFFDGMPDGLVKAFNQNEAIPLNAAKRMQRDADFANQYGGTRSDIQRLRKIISGDHPEFKGKGWLDRVRKAVKAGAILPALGAFVLTQSLQQQSPDDGS